MYMRTVQTKLYIYIIIHKILFSCPKKVMFNSTSKIRESSCTSDVQYEKYRIVHKISLMYLIQVKNKLAGCAVHMKNVNKHEYEIQNKMFNASRWW